MLKRVTKYRQVPPREILQRQLVLVGSGSVQKRSQYHAYMRLRWKIAEVLVGASPAQLSLPPRGRIYPHVNKKNKNG